MLQGQTIFAIVLDSQVAAYPHVWPWAEYASHPGLLPGDQLEVPWRVRVPRDQFGPPQLVTRRDYRIVTNPAVLEPGGIFAFQVI